MARRGEVDMGGGRRRGRRVHRLPDGVRGGGTGGEISRRRVPRGGELLVVHVPNVLVANPVALKLHPFPSMSVGEVWARISLAMCNNVAPKSERLHAEQVSVGSMKGFLIAIT